MDSKNNENDEYVNRAADILANLIREKRRKLPTPEKEAEHFKNELRAVEKLDQTFKENSLKLVQWIKQNRLNKK